MDAKQIKVARDVRAGQPEVAGGGGQICGATRVRRSRTQVGIVRAALLPS